MVKILLSIQKKIEIARTIAGIDKTELARRMGMSIQALNQRLKTGKFSDEDFKNISKALGCTYKSGFYFSDGNKVE